jgi:hypothetical protein
MAIWCRTNEELVHKYVYDDTGYQHKTPSGNFSFTDTALFSYETQIAEIDRKKNRIIMMDSYHTNTTKRHLALLYRALPSDYTVIYSNHFYWDTLYENTVNDIRNLYEQKHLKYKSGVFSRASDRHVLFVHKNTIQRLGKYKHFQRRYKKLNDFVELNQEYTNNRYKRTEERIKKRQEEIDRKEKGLRERLDAFLYGERLEAFVKYKFKSLDNYKTLAEKLPVKHDLRRYIRNYITCNPSIIGDYEGTVYYGLVWHIIEAFLHNYVLNIPSTPAKIYDIVYFNKETSKLHTTRDVEVQTNEQNYKHLLTMMNIYINNPDKRHTLISHHVGPFRINNITDKHIYVGCHCFSIENIKLLYEEMKNGC